MALPQKRKINWNFRALAFAVPFVGMVMVMILGQCQPFGNRAFLYSDAYHQYFPFFKAYREALLSGDSLLYSWDVGMGMDYLGLIAYYLGSPLNLLSIFVPEGALLSYFNFLTPIRMGLAGLFFATMLKELFQKDDLSITVFGALYATCAWALGYRWNVMWMDTFALLPLVVLGTVRLIRDKQFILYTLSLFLAIVCNYYIGFFVCIFVALVFFCYQVCRWPGFGRFFGDLGRIAFFSILAIGMTAFLELPAYAALQTTQSSINAFPEGFDLNIADEDTWQGLFDAMKLVAGQMAGGYEPTWKEGLPNLYCGIGSVLLGFLFLTAKDVKWGDKICSVSLLLLFNVSFIVRQLDYIWHGFHFTNMIPYRFSFLYSFVLLVMAYRAWLLRDSFKIWQVIAAAAMSVVVVFWSENRTDGVYLAYNLGFIAMYSGLLIYGLVEKKLPEDATPKAKAYHKMELQLRKANMALFLLTIMIVELIMSLVNFGVYLSTQSTAYYPRGTTYSASMIRYMKEREDDTLFYRAETAHAQTLNDGALNSYDGISTFTSSANVKVTEFMRVLGYGAKNTYNRYCFEEGSPVSNLFLGLKYMIERDGNERGSSVFTDVHHYGSVHLLQNNAYLPLGFLAESELAQLEYDQRDNLFTFQNQLFTAATGIDGDVWRRLQGDALTVSSENVTLRDWSTTGYCSYKSENGGEVVYNYVADGDGFMCLYLNLPKRNDVTILLNGQILYSETTSLGQMMAVGDVVDGDLIQVKLTCDAGDSGTMTLTAAIMNMDRFWEGYIHLAQSTLELTEFSNTELAGNINCNRDGLLYLSVPQNGNWHVYVDGVETETKLVLDAMIGVELTKGVHEIRLVYRNEAFSWGWKISLVCAAVFGLLAYKTQKPKPRPKHGKGKYEK